MPSSRRPSGFFSGQFTSFLLHDTAINIIIAPNDAVGTSINPHASYISDYLLLQRSIYTKAIFKIVDAWDNASTVT